MKTAIFETLKAGLGNGLKVQGEFRPLTVVPNFTSESGESDHLECPMLIALKNDYKPYLHSMEDLTNEITVGGETFVPILELAKIVFSDLFESEEFRGWKIIPTNSIWIQGIELDFSRTIDKQLILHSEGFFQAMSGFGDYEINHCYERILDWLDKHHFNRRNLPKSDYIRITPENSPYK